VSTPAAAAPTRFAALSRARAAAVAGLFLLVTGWLLTGAFGRAPSAARTDASGSDVALYEAIVTRVHAGEGYYDVVGAELRAGHYPVRPSFNWRQPTYAWLLGHLPSPLVGSALLALVGFASFATTRRWLLSSAPRAPAPVAMSLLVVAAVGAVVPHVVFLQESWAGFFIALSVALFGLERWRPAVAAGLTALAFRELALLPCVVALALALHRRRWPEVASWLAGLGVYAALMAWHVAEVNRHTLPGDLARSWVALGGAGFILGTAKWSPVLVALPDWLVAVVLPFVLLGFAGWRAPGSSMAALVVFGYVAAFGVIGNTFNDYWGMLYAPLLPLGLLAAPASVRDLGRALTARAS
jgi:hypothetical protein